MIATNTHPHEITLTVDVQDLHGKHSSNHIFILVITTRFILHIYDSVLL